MRTIRRSALLLLLLLLAATAPRGGWPPVPPAHSAEGDSGAAGFLTAKRAAGAVDTEEVELRTLRERIAAEPGNAQLHQILGRALLERNRGLEALAEFERFFEKGGDDAALLKLCGQICTWNSRPLDALPWFDRYLIRKPDDTDVLKLSAQLRVWNARQLEALPYLDRYLSHNTDDVAMIRLAGQVNVWNGRAEASIPYFDRLLAVAPDDTATVKLVGQLHLWNGRAARAIPLFRRLHDLLPGDTDAVRLLGEAYLADKRPKEALPWFRKRLAANPDDTVAIRLVGETLLADRRAGEALRHFRRLHALAPGDTRPVRLVADALNAAERPLEAIDWFKRLRRMDPADPAALRMIGCLYAWNGHPAEALPWLRRHAAAHRDPLVETLIAQSLSATDRKEEARAAFERILGRYPAPDEEARRAVAGALIYEDAPLADRALRLYAKGASPGLRLFLAGAKLRLFTNLKYRDLSAAAADATLASFAALKRPHERFADDVERAASALADAGMPTAAVELTGAALAMKPLPENAAPLLRFAHERARHRASGSADALAAIRALALAPEPPRDAGIYYAESITAEAELDAFLAAYKGPDTRRDGYSNLRFRRLLARGMTAEAALVADKLPARSVLRPRAFMALEPHEVAHARLLLALDPYDRAAYDRAAAPLSGDPDALAALSSEVALARRARELANIETLERRHDCFPEPPEPVCDLARARFWAGERTAAVDLLDTRLAHRPGEPLARLTRLRLLLPALDRLADADLEFLRAAHANGTLEPLEFSQALVKAGRLDEAARFTDDLASARPDDRRFLRQSVSLHMRNRDTASALGRIRDFLDRFGRDDGITVAEAECHLRRKDGVAANRALRHLSPDFDGGSERYLRYLRGAAKRESGVSVRSRADYSVDSERLARRNRTLDLRVPHSRDKLLLSLDSPRVDRSLGASRSIEVKRFGLLRETGRDELRALVSFLGGDGGDAVRPDLEWRRGDRFEFHLRHDALADTPEGLAGGFRERIAGGSGALRRGPFRLDWRYDRIVVFDGNRGVERGVTFSVLPWKGAPLRLTLAQSMQGFRRTGLTDYYAPERKHTRAYGVIWSPRFLPLYVSWRHYLESNGNEGSGVYGALPVTWRGMRFTIDTSYSESKSGRFEARRYHSRHAGITFDRVF